MSTHFETSGVPAAYSDGRSPLSTPAEVRLVEEGLLIDIPGARQGLRLWHYSDLATNVPLSRGAPDMLLHRKGGGEETLFIAAEGFASALLEQAPSLSAFRQRLRWMRPGLATVLAVALVAATIYAFDLHPAQAVARLMPMKSRETLGRSVITSIAGKYKACETPAARAALDKLSTRLAKAASNEPLPLRVLLLDWDVVNAFAVPGGQIILTRGLVQKAGGPDEVAGVLAHEIGHTLELHPETSLVRLIGLSAAAQIVLVGSSSTVSNIGLVLTQIQYTRIAEREADAHAVRMLRNAGISAKGFGDFFVRLEGPSAGKSNGSRSIFDSDVIRTHSLTADRIDFVRKQPGYAATPALSAEEWQALRSACGAPPAPPKPTTPATPPSPTTSLPTAPESAASAAVERDIAEATRALGVNPFDVAQLNKRAIAYTRQAKHDLALADWTRAAELRPTDANLQVSRGTALDNLRRYEEALKAYEQALSISPDHSGARNRHGLTNRTLKRYEAALTDFDLLIASQPKFVAGYYNRSLIYLDLNRTEDARRDLDRLIEIDKDYAAAYTQRGLLHEKAGRQNEAIVDFRAALTASPKSETGAWAHRVARERLAALGASAGGP